jgi:hypothetical protein
MALIVRGRWKSRKGVTDWITEREMEKKKVTCRCRGDVKEVFASKLACSRGKGNRELKE